MKKLLVFISALAIIALPALTLAVPPAPSDPISGVSGGTAFSDINGVITFINTIANWMLAFLIALAVIFIIWGAFKYIRANGDEKAIGTAKTAIVYALIGVAVGFVAKGLVMVVQNFVR